MCLYQSTWLNQVQHPFGVMTLHLEYPFWLIAFFMWSSGISFFFYSFIEFAIALVVRWRRSRFVRGVFFNKWQTYENNTFKNLLFSPLTPNIWPLPILKTNLKVSAKTKSTKKPVQTSNLFEFCAWTFNANIYLCCFFSRCPLFLPFVCRYKYFCYKWHLRR